MTTKALHPEPVDDEIGGMILPSLLPFIPWYTNTGTRLGGENKHSLDEDCNECPPTIESDIH
jgi:hypothetical protein